MFKTLPLTARQLQATESRLQAIYDAASLGLKGDSLALAAGMLPSEFRRLREMDPIVEMAELKGRADAEAELSGHLMTAARNGDAKATLEILKHRFDWVAKQAVSVEVNQTISVIAALKAAEQRVIDIDTIDETPTRANESGLLTNASTQEVEDGYQQSNTRALARAVAL